MYTELITLIATFCCTSFCLAEASTTFEDLSLGGCHCKSCNCGSVVQECPTDHNMAIEHKRDVTSFHDLKLSECSCEACTCDKILDIEDCSEGADHTEKPELLYKNCKELFDNGHDESGVYTVNIDSENSFEVYCDMETDGGGWTVFQRRVNGSVDFYRNWTEYQNGFGDLMGEFWLGLDKSTY